MKKGYNKNNGEFATWRIAYLARDLRHNKTITVSCHESEKDNLLKQLQSFSNTSNISMKSNYKPHSNEVLLEIINS